MAPAQKCFENHKSLHTWKGLLIPKEYKPRLRLSISLSHSFNANSQATGQAQAIHGDQDRGGIASRKLTARRESCRRPVIAGGMWGAAGLGLQDKVAQAGEGCLVRPPRGRIIMFSGPSEVKGPQRASSTSKGGMPPTNECHLR